MVSDNNHNGFNADELEAPNWMNLQFFTEVLSHHDKSPQLKVLDFNISPASAKGDHYASVMFRGKVTYTTEKGEFTKSLIVKTMPEIEGHKKDMLGKSYIFETEIGMYTKVLPKFEEILRSVDDDTKLCVPCLYHSVEPRKVMVFEDLVEMGYTVIRDRAATIEEMHAGFSKLAKWHAISFKILNENPEFFSEFKNGIFDIPNIMEDQFFTTGMDNFNKMLESTPEFSKYLPLFKKKEKVYLDEFKRVMEEYRENRQPNGYYILSHGDFHLRNMMFKFNKTSGSFEDCMLLDFQFSNICSFTADVIYSIYMLMGPEDRQTNCKDLLKFYFSTFVETLKKIDFKGELPNEAEFWNQIRRHKAYDLFMLTTFFPMMNAFKTNNMEMSDVIDKPDVRSQIYFADTFLAELRILLPRFEEQGYLN